MPAVKVWLEEDSQAAFPLPLQWLARVPAHTHHKMLLVTTTMHCILRRGPRAPAHTRSLTVALQSLF